jgi:hypothetical protein
MIKNHLRIAVAALVAGVFGVALSASAATAPAHHRARQHGLEVRGTITAVNEEAKTVTIKDMAGKETELSWTTATQVHGTMAVGAEATVRYMNKEGHDVASSIRVTPAGAPGAASSTAKAKTKTK